MKGQNLFSRKKKKKYFKMSSAVHCTKYAKRKILIIYAFAARMYLANILHKSIASRYRPVSYADGPDNGPL